ncbi:MAG: DUF6339 family protein [Actinomycetota bacterium]
MLLYPRLLHSEAGDLARERASLSLEDARAKSTTAHAATVFNPTGGTRVEPSELDDLQRTVRAIAAANGYPEQLDVARRQRFDADAAAALKTHMGISASEASQTAVWSFIACILLPDIVRWRYPGQEQGTTLERFIGGSRGIRNALGRLWWRGHLLGRTGDFSLLRELGEDELVQITERPVLAGNPAVARLFAQRFLDHAREFEELSRSDLMRDAIKRLRRLMSFVALDLLTANQLRDVIDQVLGNAAVALGIEADRVGKVATGYDRDPQPGTATDTTSGPTISDRFDQLPADVPSTLAELISLFEAAAVEIVDRRDSNGCLWVVDQPGLDDVIELLTEHGYPFLLVESGSRSTDHRRAWYLPHDFVRDGTSKEADPEEPDDRIGAEAGAATASSEDLRHMGLWEQGVFDDIRLKPDYQVLLSGNHVEVSDGTRARTIRWRLDGADDELASGLRELVRIGPETALLAIVAATFVHQQDFVKAGRTALYGMTLRQVADYLSTHESTISRAKSDVYVETPSGILPLEYFFSSSVKHRSGGDVSARAVRIILREIVQTEIPESPYTDDKISMLLAGRGYSIARRTVAKYRDILGIPSTSSRKRRGQASG